MGLSVMNMLCLSSPLWREDGSLVYNCCWSSPAHSRVRVPRDSWPYFTVSDLRHPQPGGPGPHIFIPHEQGGLVITPGTGFRFRRVLLLAELGWRYSNPPPSLISDKTLVLLIQPRVEQHIKHRFQQFLLWRLRPGTRRLATAQFFVELFPRNPQYLSCRVTKRRWILKKCDVLFWLSVRANGWLLLMWQRIFWFHKERRISCLTKRLSAS
jgi:hypothetical protein